LIEQLEPGLQDFVPCELRYGDEGPWQPYFCVRVQQSFDPAAHDDQRLRWITQPNGNRIWRKPIGSPMPVDRIAVMGKHLWFYYHLFCSDELHDAIQAAGLVTAWSFEKQFVV
ncbi:MAG: DUF1629 domain-containing protein, partial [Pseudomonadota bacterium]